MAQANLHSYFKPKTPTFDSSLLDEAHDNTCREREVTIPPKSVLSTQPLSTFEKAHDAVTCESKQIPRSASAFSCRPLDLRAQIVRVDPTHLTALKRLTSSTLPVRYAERFYNETVTNNQIAEISRAVLFNENPVGWIRCRLEPTTHPLDSSTTTHIYIQALCLLAPYRGSGFATHLLNAILESETVTNHNATFVYAHVWENSEDALVWYEKRHFKRTMLVDQYYRKLRPSGAWILRKDLS